MVGTIPIPMLPPSGTVLRAVLITASRSDFRCQNDTTPQLHSASRTMPLPGCGSSINCTPAAQRSTSMTRRCRQPHQRTSGVPRRPVWRRAAIRFRSSNFIVRISHSKSHLSKAADTLLPPSEQALQGNLVMVTIDLILPRNAVAVFFDDFSAACALLRSMSPRPVVARPRAGAQATSGCGFAATGSVQFLLTAFRVARPRTCEGSGLCGTSFASSGTCHPGIETR